MAEEDYNQDGRDGRINFKYCIVQFLAWEVDKKHLKCEDCPIKEDCIDKEQE